jgi:hypothetical protein
MRRIPSQCYLFLESGAQFQVRTFSRRTCRKERYLPRSVVYRLGRFPRWSCGANSWLIVRFLAERLSLKYLFTSLHRRPQRAEENTKAAAITLTKEDLEDITKVSCRACSLLDNPDS